MKIVYSEPLRLLTCHCDMHGAWRPSSILEAMQEVSGAHCEAMEIGIEELKKQGIAWVLSRMKVMLQRIPRVGERLTIETYPVPSRHGMYLRSCIFRDARGEEIGHATSIWVLMDIETRRIVRSPYVDERHSIAHSMRPATPLPLSVKPLGTEAVVETLIPKFSDFDLNQHVNNTKYFDWCCNALGIDIMEHYQIIGFDVNYDSEITEGRTVRTELRIDSDQFTYCGFGSDDRRLFAIKGSLEKQHGFK